MSGMAEVLKAHRIDTYQNETHDETRWICTNDACDFETDNWSGNLAEDRIADHHDEVLTAAGFGPMQETADRVGKRYAELHQMLRDELQAVALEEAASVWPRHQATHMGKGTVKQISVWLRERATKIREGL